MLKLPKLISEGCVLQYGKAVKIYGTDDPFSQVSVTLQDQQRTSTADEQGKWEILLQGLKAGGPYCMKVENQKGETISFSCVYVGEVWLCSGQSNMELPMERVKDRYPEEFTLPLNESVRMFKIPEHYEFNEPLSDHIEGEWKADSKENRRNFSATAYFFGKELYLAKKIPIGLIDASKGGSRIEAWMSKEALLDYPALLKEAECFKEKDAPACFVQEQEGRMMSWMQQIEKQEQYAKGSYGKLIVPGFLKDAGLKDFCGSILLSRKFYVSESMLKEDEFHSKSEVASLWLGTMVDSDKTYLNGKLVGETGYQYPPRKYSVPMGLLHTGENEICIRLVCNDGHGRLTPGKEFKIFNKNWSIDLSGEWDYKILCQTEKAPEMDFLCRKATGLYQAMIAPCLSYTIRGIFWYQGESNDRRYWDYAKLLQKMILSWRQGFQEELPFLVAQLPDFEIDLVLDQEKEGDVKKKSGWPEIREAQAKAEELPKTAVTVNLELGEDNDLHPLNKKDLAHRAFLAAQSVAYEEKICYRGPILKEWFCIETKVRLCFETGGGKLQTMDGKEAEEFWIAGKDRHFFRARAEVKENEVFLESDQVKDPAAVRYAWSNAPRLGLLCNEEGLLASPFRTDDWEDAIMESL